MECGWWEGKKAVSPVVARSPGKEVGEGGREGGKRSVKTPGDHRAMDAIGSIDWKGKQGTRTFQALTKNMDSVVKTLGDNITVTLREIISYCRQIFNNLEY